MPICRECGQELSYINHKHVTKHGMNLQDYQKKYPEANLQDEEMKVKAVQNTDREEIRKKKIETLKNENKEKIRQLNQLDTTEKSYIAGFVDGEGSLSISKTEKEKGNYYSASIGIYNSNKETIDWIKQRLPNTNTNCDDRRGLDSRGVEALSECYAININKKSAVYAILEVLKPYLLNKSELADLISDFIKHTQERKGGYYEEDFQKELEKYYQQSRRLNK